VSCDNNDPWQVHQQYGQRAANESYIEEGKQRVVSECDSDIIMLIAFQDEG
jgi:hypothetical protein